MPYIKGVKIVKPLNLIPYVLKDVQYLLETEYGWEPYPQKHFESMITKFIEGYWLPKRFNYDVRRHQLSSLVVTGQMTREEALDKVKTLTLNDEEAKQLFSDVAGKLEISEAELHSYMDMPLWENHYKNSQGIYNFGKRYSAYLAQIPEFENNQ